MFKIEVDEDGYQLVVGEEESGVTDYGELAEVTADGMLYFVTVDEEEEPEDAKIYRMVDGHPEVVEETHEVEEVVFELEADEEGEEEDEEEAEPAA